MRYGERGALVVAAALLAGTGGGAGAQRAGGDSVDERDGTHGRAVLLRLRPRVGDTVRTRFEQTVQLFAQGAEGGARGADLAATGMAGTMIVLAHSVVERVDDGGALVTAFTDSVVLRASGAPPEATEAARRGMQGRRARLRVAADGATAVLAGAGRAASPMKFPAALPPGAVLPGAMWARTMTVPWGGARGGPPGGALAGPPGPTIDVWFRFDSLARGGTLAFLSLRGTVHGAGRRHTEPGAAEASSVNGALVVDLARGWVVDSRTTFQLDGAITQPGAAPRPARVVVTQRLRVL